MKKLYLLLSIGIASIAVDSFTMLGKLHTPKNIASKPSLRLHSTQINSQNNNSDTSIAALELYFTSQSMKDNIIGEGYNTTNLTKEAWDYYGGQTPWHRFNNTKIEKSLINDWIAWPVSAPYNRISTIADDMENALNSDSLPSWIDKNKIKRPHDLIKKQIQANLAHINEHKDFLLQHNSNLNNLHYSGRFSFKKSINFLCNKFLLNKELERKTNQLQNTLTINNQIIFSNITTITGRIHNEFYMEKSKKNSE